MIKNNNNNSKYKRQSPFLWAKEFSLNVLDYSKGFTKEEYECGLLNKEDFLNKISLCQIQKPEVTSRRDAAAYFSKLNNKDKN